MLNVPLCAALLIQTSRPQSGAHAPVRIEIVQAQAAQPAWILSPFTSGCPTVATGIRVARDMGANAHISIKGSKIHCSTIPFL